MNAFSWIVLGVIVAWAAGALTYVLNSQHSGCGRGGANCCGDCSKCGRHKKTEQS